MLIHPIRIFIFLNILVYLFFACKNKDAKNTSGANQSLKSGSGAFVAHTIYANTKTEEKFLSLLKIDYLPIWRKLKNDNILSELSLFKLTQKDSSKKDRTLCNYLIVAQLYPDVKPNEFLNTEKLAKNSNSGKSPLFQIQRTEVLQCTPNAYFPAVNNEKNDIIYLLEFIAVQDSADYVNQYHTLMQKYFGPLNGVLVKERKLHSIFMLKTVEGIFQRDNRFNWNQLHISGEFSEFVDLNWDSLYTDLFRRTFSCELDSVWALLPPRLENSFDCTGRLIQELHIK